MLEPPEVGGLQRGSAFDLDPDYLALGLLGNDVDLSCGLPVVPEASRLRRPRGLLTRKVHDVDSEYQSLQVGS